jgi:hypothetical protein
VGVSSYALLNAIFAHVFPISSESRKYISVQWVIPRSTLQPLKELVVCRLLRDHDNTLWFALWSSNAIFWTPLDLRAWTLGFGVQLRPEIFVVTVERYYSNVNRNLAGATTEMKREIEGTRVVEESVQPKKKRKSRFWQLGTPLVTMDSRYEEGIQIMRNFLRLGNAKASFLQRIPAALGTVEAIDNQVADYWLPTIRYFFGSVETFLFHFSRSDDGNQALQRLIESGNG